jgi:hypothetical protein
VCVAYLFYVNGGAAGCGRRCVYEVIFVFIDFNGMCSVLIDELQSEKCVDEVLRLLRKLPWDEECYQLMVQIFTNVHIVNYQNLPSMASLLAGLQPYHGIGVHVVDQVLENIRDGCMHPVRAVWVWCC